MKEGATGPAGASLATILPLWSNSRSAGSPRRIVAGISLFYAPIPIRLVDLSLSLPWIV